jgi:hypothetical protein
MAYKIILTLTLNLLTTTIVAPPSNAIKWQMGFNSAFKGLKIMYWPMYLYEYIKIPLFEYIYIYIYIYVCIYKAYQYVFVKTTPHYICIVGTVLVKALRY